MKHLLILSYGASGTSAFVDYLMNNNYIQMERKEPLRPYFLPEGEHPNWYSDFIVPRLEKAESENKKLLIHVKPHHLRELNVSLSDGVQIFKDAFDFILIHRKNYLSIEISSKYKPFLKDQRDRTITLNAKSILKKFETMERINQQFALETQPYKRYMLEYESNININLRQTIQSVTSHFGIYHEFEYRRQLGDKNSQKNYWSDLKIEQKLENFYEIKKTLESTRFEWMLWE